jgi:reactive intermediate/imine deaminase
VSLKEGITITGKAPSPLGAYSHAVKAGNFLFVSGQGARNADTGKEEGVQLDASGKVLSYDIEVQTEWVIKNLKVVLEEAGLSLEDVVDMSVFLADMDDFAKYNGVYAKHFSFPNPPARTTIQAARLPGKNFIEIKAIALCK